MKVAIRKAEEKDVGSIVELSSALFQEDAGQHDPFMNLNWPREEGDEYYTKTISGENSVCMLAVADGTAVGFLTGYVKGEASIRPVCQAELESMFVAEAFRGQGVGSGLAQAFLDWCRQRGVQRVTVTAYWANVGAIEFYKRLGFEPKELTLELGID
jgi:GNAT superfamily N-acetyltransferase